MIDTVIGKRDVPIREIKWFKNWNSTVNRDTRGTTYRRYYKRFPVGDFSTLGIFAETRFGKASVGFEASLPKMLFDNNVRVLTTDEVSQAAEYVSNLVQHYTGFDFDALNVRTSRADLVCSWNLTEDEVNRRLDVTKLVRYGGKHTRVIDKEKGVSSVYHGRKSYYENYLYSKHAETMLRVKQGTANDEHLRASIGNLRLEDCRYTAKLRQDAERFGFGKYMTLANLLQAGIVKQLLMEDMKNLQLDRPIAGRDEREHKLEMYCGSDTAKYARLWGILDTVIRRGEKGAIDYLGYDLVRRGRIELTNAGIWLAAENRLPLPALRPPDFGENIIDLGSQVRASSNTYQTLAPVQTYLN